jgi:tRNA G26 N,N-dimethylase Trm1
MNVTTMSACLLHVLSCTHKHYVQVVTQFTCSSAEHAKCMSELLLVAVLTTKQHAKTLSGLQPELHSPASNCRKLHCHA